MPLQIDAVKGRVPPGKCIQGAAPNGSVPIRGHGPRSSRAATATRCPKAPRASWSQGCEGAARGCVRGARVSVDFEVQIARQCHRRPSQRTGWRARNPRGVDSGIGHGPQGPIGNADVPAPLRPPQCIQAVLVMRPRVQRQRLLQKQLSRSRRGQCIRERSDLDPSLEVRAPMICCRPMGMLAPRCGLSKLR